VTDERRERNEQEPERSASGERNERQERDDLARRREQIRQPPLTNREREERWPIG
jgi:hypothetical protein